MCTRYLHRRTGRNTRRATPGGLRRAVSEVRGAPGLGWRCRRDVPQFGWDDDSIADRACLPVRVPPAPPIARARCAVPDPVAWLILPPGPSVGVQPMAPRASDLNGPDAVFADVHRDDDRERDRRPVRHRCRAANGVAVSECCVIDHGHVSLSTGVAVTRGHCYGRRPVAVIGWIFLFRGDRLNGGQVARWPLATLGGLVQHAGIRIFNCDLQVSRRVASAFLAKGGQIAPWPPFTVGGPKAAATCLVCHFRRKLPRPPRPCREARPARH